MNMNMNFMSGWEAKIQELKEKYALMCSIPSLNIGTKKLKLQLFRGEWV